jgi:hypothetical protein
VGTKRKDFWLTAGRNAGLAGGNGEERGRALAAPVPVFLIFSKHGRHFNGNHSHLQIDGGKAIDCESSVGGGWQGARLPPEIARSSLIDEWCNAPAGYCTLTMVASFLLSADRAGCAGTMQFSTGIAL